MKRQTLMLAGLIAIALLAAPAARAQCPADTTLRYGLFQGRTLSAFVRSQFVGQVVATRTGPDSAPASTAPADSILLPPIPVKGCTIQLDAWGTASASNAKSVVVKITAAGATTKIDSLQMKTGGGNWHVTCYLTIRNATSGAATGDSLQTIGCTHIGSGDSSTTASAAPLTTTVKLVANSGTNRIFIHNSAGTAVGDVVVTRLLVTMFPGGRVNP